MNKDTKFWQWLWWNLRGRIRCQIVDENDNEVFVPDYQWDKYWQAYRKRHPERVT